MEPKVMWTTGGHLLCLCDDRGTIIGWIPYPKRRDPLGPGRETVFLMRPAMIPAVATPRAA